MRGIRIRSQREEEQYSTVEKNYTKKWNLSKVMRGKRTILWKEYVSALDCKNSPVNYDTECYLLM